MITEPDQDGMQLVTSRRDRIIVVPPCEDSDGNGTRDTIGFFPLARTQCFKCRCWCWLGNKTFEFVKAGEALPMCPPCAAEVLAEMGVDESAARYIEDD